MKVTKLHLKEAAEKVLHTKSNGDKLVANDSGYGYSAYTRDNVHIGHIEAETDAAAVAEFSKKEPKYEDLDMSVTELQATADRYLDVEIDELMREILAQTGNMTRPQLSRLVRLCRNFYALLEEFASSNLTEGYMDVHEGKEHVDTLDLMAALKSVVKEYGHMELVTPVYCKLQDDDHGRRLALNTAVEEKLVPDKIVPDKIGGDVNLNLDGSHSSVGFLGGTATNTNNGEEGDHEATNSHKEDLNEAMSKDALAGIFGELSKVYGKVMLNSEQADKILEACGKEPEGKKATLDEILAVAQDVLATAPLAASAVVGLIEAVFDVLMWAVTAGLIALPLDGPVGEIITGFLAAVPVTVIVGAITAVPAAIANRLVLLARKALRKEDAEKVEKAAADAGVESTETNESVDDDFMDAENIEMKDLDSPVGKEEDIEFVMSEYIPESLLIEFVKKIDRRTYLVGVEDEVVKVEFDPNWSEYVYTIEGKGPYSHSSYEYIARDIHDFVMANRTDNSSELDEGYGNDEMTEFLDWIQDYKGGCLWDAFTAEFNMDEDPDIDDVLNWLEEFDNDAYYAYIEKDEYDDDYEDLSAFESLNEVRKANKLFGINESADMNVIRSELKKEIAKRGLKLNPEVIDIDSAAEYIASAGDDYSVDQWIKDTKANYPDHFLTEAFDRTSAIDLSRVSWQVASMLDVEALGEADWIEFVCDDPRDQGREKVMRFEAIGEDAHKYGFIRTAGDRCEVKFRNGSEAMCNSSQEIARFIAGEFGISL